MSLSDLEGLLWDPEDLTLPADHSLGVLVCKPFKAKRGAPSALYFGTVVAQSPAPEDNLFRVVYEDGDSEDMDCHELQTAQELYTANCQNLDCDVRSAKAQAVATSWLEQAPAQREQL